MIAAFGTHPNLKEFHIGAMDLSESELRCLVDFPKLKRAYVCCPVSESITEYLHGHVQIIPLYLYQTYNDIKRSKSLDFHYDLDNIDDLESLEWFRRVHLKVFLITFKYLLFLVIDTINMIVYS